MSDTVLAADGVSVERGDSRILDDVTLSVDAGDRLLVQGTSGAGKTTLFSILGLLDVPDAGTVTVDGRETTELSERERAKLRRSTLGFVFQDFKLVPDLTARENAALPQDHRGERDDDWLDELFDRLGIADVADRSPASLSGGEKQRVATARALANRPDVVLADEPTGQLDPDTASDMINLLCDVQSTYETALLVVSHDRSFVERFRRVVRLENGAIRTDR